MQAGQLCGDAVMDAGFWLTCAFAKSERDMQLSMVGFGEGWRLECRRLRKAGRDFHYIAERDKPSRLPIRHHQPDSEAAWPAI